MPQQQSQKNGVKEGEPESSSRRSQVVAPFDSRRLLAAANVVKSILFRIWQNSK